MRRSLAAAAALGATIGAAGWLSALGIAPSKPLQQGAPEQLKPELAVFEPFLGHAWEIETRWVSGDVLKARHEYRAILGGQFVEVVTKAANPDGSIYQRYRTVFAYDAAENLIKAYTFTSDGEARVAVVELGSPADASPFPPLRSGWVQDAGGQRIEVRQEVRLLDETSYAWKVWMAEPGAAAFQQMMDGVWKRGERLTD